MNKPEMLGGLTLAFVGDAVYELLVRESIAEEGGNVGNLHLSAVEQVNANAQARAYSVIDPMLTEKEAAIFRRGRNARVTNIPKGTDGPHYHIATGLEALFGYLYLNGETERIAELFSAIRSDASGGDGQR